jgi:hypothetical protein
MLTAVFLVFGASVTIAIYFNTDIRAGIASDALTFHIPQILAMKSPDFSLSEGPYFTAMIPFFHFLAANLLPIDALPPMAGYDFPLLAIALTCGLLIVRIAYDIAPPEVRVERRTFLQGGIFVACVLGSYYVFLPFSVYNTDSIAAAMLLTAIWGYYRKRHITAAIALTLAILFKSIYLPVIALPLLLEITRTIRERRVSRDALRLPLTAIPALFCVLTAYLYWGGLIPPGVGRSLNHPGFYGYPLLHFAAYFAVAGMFFLSWKFWIGFSLLTTRMDWIVLAVLQAFLVTIWILYPSNFSVEEGRFGSLVWTFSRHGEIGDRSVTLLVLALAGSTLLVKLRKALSGDDFFHGMLLALCVYGFSLSFTHAAYQRYLEPITVMCLMFGYFGSATHREYSSPAVMKVLFLVYNIAAIIRAF